MLKQTITPKEVVDFLNELLKVDRKGISDFFDTKTVVNNDLAGHPTVQVRGHTNTDPNDNVYTVAPLGVLNGMFGTDEDGWGCIYREVEENRSTIVEFGIVSDKTKGK